MKFMHNDNSKSLNAKSVLVNADRVAAGMDLVNGTLITGMRLSTGTACLAGKDFDHQEFTETKCCEETNLHLSTEVNPTIPTGRRSSTSYRQHEPSWQGVSYHRRKPGNLNRSSIQATLPQANQSFQKLIEVISHDGTANLPVGKQRNQQRFLNGFHDEAKNSKHLSSRHLSSSNKKSFGISL